MDLNAIPVPNRDVCMRQVGDETVFLAESGSEIVNLNAMGSYIWDLVDGNHSLADILDIICAEYEVEPEVAAVDLERFVTELAEHDLIRWQDPGA